MVPNISNDDSELVIERLKSLDLSITSYEDIWNTLNKEIALPYVITEMYAGNYIERIRINKENEVFTSTKDLSYRSDLKNIKTFGRANSPGHSIFYGAVISSPIPLPRIVALAETEELLRGSDKGKIDKNLTMTVSKWKITKTMLLSEIVFMKNRIAKRPEIEKAYQFHLTNFRKNMPEQQVQKILSILEFFSEEFAKSNINSDQDYKLSAAYAECAFRSGTIQGIMYPSVRTEYEGSNVALLPKTVDTHL